jgi:hypothetical protein
MIINVWLCFIGYQLKLKRERENFIFIGMIKSMHILHYEYLQTKKFEVFVDRFLLDIEYHRLIGQIHPSVS